MAPMATSSQSSSGASSIPIADLDSFSAHLRSSKRILALLGAGLSASSGLPTFRGAGGLWRTHDAMSLATPEAFEANPGLVWQFYSYRRHMALKAKPNRAHYALAELARRKEFLTLSQNVDGLSQRASHPKDSLQLLHGSLYDVKCTSFWCPYLESDNFTDPIVPALALPTNEADPTTDAARQHQAAAATAAAAAAEEELDISDAAVALPELAVRDLPHCPKCEKGLLRPGVVWFGEMLPEKTLRRIDAWIAESEKIDLIMVIGTSSKVYPAAAYVDKAKAKGARVAVVNRDEKDVPGRGLRGGDWFFQGDAAVVVPEILKAVVGEVRGPK